MPGPRWVRVRDPRTGHEFDRREDDPAVISGRFVRTKPERYPPSWQPRPAKYRPRKLAGLSASREPTARSARPEVQEATEGEMSDG